MFGAGHALTLGHGKTMVKTYLIGSQATAKQAILLGFVTTITHTVSIFVLGILAFLASEYIVPKQLYPVLSFLRGLSMARRFSNNHGKLLKKLVWLDQY
ncbi:MAG: hypothetical protein AAF349_03670 [Cyanobacteria bacterium P01_A01_bin.68]